MVDKKGFRYGNSMALYNYIESCLKRDENPDPKEMVIALLPRAHKLGLVCECLRWDCPSPPDPVLRWA